MRIFITGSKGFIGKRLVDTLSTNSKIEVITFNRSDGENILDKHSLFKFEKSKIDLVIHLAGNTFVPQSWEQPSIFIEDNVLGTSNVLEFARNMDAALIFLSTYVYGANAEIPITENTEVAPLNPYALSKYLAEQQCEFYSKNFGLKITTLRLFNVYGPGQKDSFLIPKIFRQTLGDQDEIEVMTLSPKRDYVYVDDVVNAIVAAIKSPTKEYRCLNIASGISYSVEEVVAMVQKILNTSKPVIAKADLRVNEIMDTQSAVSAAKTELRWEPKYTFEEGLREIARNLE